MLKLLRKLVRCSDGQDLIEYALMAAAITTLTVAVVNELGNKVSSYVVDTADRVNSGLGGEAPAGEPGGGGDPGGGTGSGTGGGSGGGTGGGGTGGGGRGGGKK